jgi:hypothetical protein
MKSPTLLTLTLLLLTSSVLSTPLPAPNTASITNAKRSTNTVDNDYYPQPHTGWGGGNKRDAAAATTHVDDDYYPQPHTGWGGGSKAKTVAADAEAEKEKRDGNTVDVHYYAQAHTGWGSWGKAEGGAE